MKFKRISKQSLRGKIIGRCDKMHLEILKKERGTLCEICGRPPQGSLGRSHILPVGMYPRSRYLDENVLLAGWFDCHYPLHHHNKFENAERYAAIERKLGKEYYTNLLIVDKGMPKMSMFRLQMYKKFFEQKLEGL